MQGENAPPLHPRCRCTIAPEVEGTRLAGRKRIPASVDYSEWRENLNLNRRNANIDAFKQLEVPMQKREVTKLCRKYGVDISGLKIKIQRDADLLRLGLAGSAAPENIGRIDLFPNAFQDTEQLLRTVIHEGCHVKQFRKYGAEYVQLNRVLMEKVAERYERLFYKSALRRRGNER